MGLLAMHARQNTWLKFICQLRKRYSRISSKWIFTLQISVEAEFLEINASALLQSLEIRVGVQDWKLHASSLDTLQVLQKRESRL
jgi:hypothetical protein